MGAAVGDAIGLPREGLSRLRAVHLFGAPPLKHCFFFRRGMGSDDTEHALMTACALLESRLALDGFAKRLAWRLRFWLMRCPAGVGLATLRAAAKLWLGFGPEHSGVYSAGNGPAMRSHVLGVFFSDDMKLLKESVRISTRLTHTDPRAEEGALAIAIAAAHATRQGVHVDPEFVLGEIADNISGEELHEHLRVVKTALTENLSVFEFADRMGWQRGISGYINHTVPFCVFAWLRHRDSFRDCVESAICCGGDSDTVGSIVGALSGATLGKDAIPAEWLSGLMEWPQSVAWIEALAAGVHADPDQSKALPPLFWPAYIVRQPLFMAIVLAHGLRRMFPPWT